jgi:hypothetical protein
MTPKEKLDLLQAEVVSYRKILSGLERVYGEILNNLYGPVDDRAREAIREELDTARNVALRYDIMLERQPPPLSNPPGERFRVQ